jgi:DNA-binding response OmpR family regulator
MTVTAFSDDNFWVHMATILLVDDSDDVRKLLERGLIRAGHTVITATNGSRGLKALDAGSYDLIVTDIVMPDMEGLQFIRSIRKANATIPIIAMSGGGRGTADDYLEMASRFGAAKTLEKPFTLDVLTTAIDEVLGAAP